MAHRVWFPAHCSPAPRGQCVWDSTLCAVHQEVSGLPKGRHRARPMATNGCSFRWFHAFPSCRNIISPSITQLPPWWPHQLPLPHPHEHIRSDEWSSIHWFCHAKWGEFLLSVDRFENPNSLLLIGPFVTLKHVVNELGSLLKGSAKFGGQSRF